jgi:ABC-type cobalamin/Fe3+-siderophores transport system ATPase subunit
MKLFCLNRYSCFAGPNGAGKSSVLAAMNVFFRGQSGAASDVTKLIDALLLT